MVKILVFTALAVVILAAAPRAHAAPPGVSGCEPPNCPSNSPAHNEFAYNKLDGSKIAVDPGESTDCKIPKGRKATLERHLLPKEANPRGWELVVVDDKRHVICSGKKLVGIHFGIRSRWMRIFSKTFQFIITDVGIINVDVPEFPQRGAGTDRPVDAAKPPDATKPSAESRYAYLFAQQITPGISFCTNGHVSTDTARYAPVTPPAEVYQISNGLAAQYAIILPSVIGTDDDVQQMTIACAGDAFAKTDLLGLVSPYDPVRERRAAEHMIMARYDGIHATTELGIPISWYKYVAGADAPNGQKLEAVWDSGGALCVSHSRLWRKGRVIAASKTFKNEKEYLDALGKDSCDTYCKGDACKDKLTSYVVDPL